MKNKSYVFIRAVILVSAALFALSACDRPDKTRTGGARKLKVVTTIFPLYDMARAIGGGHADVFLLLPPGVEAHSFEPTPGDIVRIKEADIFIYTGKFMEPWAEALVRGVDGDALLPVNAGNGVELMPEAGTHRGPAAAAPDPHIWLNFDNAKAMAENIHAAFLSKDPGNKSSYREAAAVYEGGLTALDSAFKSGLSSCRTRELIYGGHYAFGYLARRYGIKYMAAQGLSPDSEPTAKDLASLVEQVKKDKIKFIFYEELASPKIAETIAAETGVKMLPLSAAHNISKEQAARGVSFFDILQGDLESLKTGLECSDKK